MTAVTELVTVTIRDGFDIDTKGTKAYEIWQDTLSTISGNEGFRGLSYGHTLENPPVVQLVIRTSPSS